MAQQDGQECEKIAGALKDELSVLSKVIPNLHTITGPASDSSEVVVVNNGKDCFTRLKLSCRKFLSSIASEKHPVVLHLDDLQWADQASIEVLQSLVTDRESKHILIIGTQRNADSPQGAEYSPLKDILHLPGSELDCLPCTAIQLGNFDCYQVAELVSNLLNTPPSKIVELSELILKRTDGLPFFVVKFMEMLKDKWLLVYDDQRREWGWSISDIQAETTASENVVDMVAVRIQKLKKKSQCILRLASVQGFRFERDVLVALAAKDESVMKKKKKSSDDPLKYAQEQVEKALNVAMRKGLVEKNHDESFKFSHDRIHGCLYFTIPSNELCGLHLSVGRVLQEMYTGDERHLFAIADHLNQSSQLLVTSEDKLNCGQCNLWATDLAINKSAYSLAAEYACHGLTQIDTDTKWNNYYYKLSLDLHCLAADAYYGCGDIERCDENLEQVFQNARSVRDCCRAYSIKVRSLGAQARLEEAIEVAFAVARKLGVVLPKKPKMRHAIWQIIKTKRMLRGKTDEQLLVPPVDTGESSDMYQALTFLGIATHYASLSLKIPYLCLSIVKMLQLTIKGQASDPSVFASYGILAAVMKDIPEAVRMGRLSLQYRGKETGMHVALSISHTFLLHWRTPFHESLEPLVRATHMGMDVGDFDAAFMAIQGYIRMSFYCGHPLPELEQQIRASCAEMFAFDNRSHIYQSLPYWQLFLNLLGQNENPTILTGEAMNQQTLSAEASAANVDVVPHTINALRLMLCYHFEDAPSLVSLVAKYEEHETPHIGHFMYYISRFYAGLACIALYRTSGKRPYKRKTLKVIKQMQNWTKDGCVNTKPLLSLLEAEMATLVKPAAVNAVHATFVQAIDDANEVENSCLAALANQRAAHYFDVHTPDQPEASEYMRRALELYNYWGATAKVTYLEETYHWLIDSPPKQDLPTEILANSL